MTNNAVMKRRFVAEGVAIRGFIADGERSFKRAAEKLVEVRKQLPHGAWLPWLEANGIAERTARQLIDEHAHPEKADKRRADQATRDREARNRPRMADLDGGNVVPLRQPEADDEEEDYGPCDSDETIRKRGFLNRAGDALRLAKYDDLAGFKPDKEVVKAVAAAAAAWNVLLLKLKESVLT